MKKLERLKLNKFNPLTDMDRSHIKGGTQHPSLVTIRTFVPHGDGSVTERMDDGYVCDDPGPPYHYA